MNERRYHFLVGLLMVVLILLTVFTCLIVTQHSRLIERCDGVLFVNMDNVLKEN